MKPVPNLHMVIITVATILILFSGALYYIAPPDKAPLFKDTMNYLLFFLFGKLTNGFGFLRQDASDGKPTRSVKGKTDESPDVAKNDSDSLRS